MSIKALIVAYSHCYLTVQSYSTACNVHIESLITTMALKWGIASAGKISWDFVNAVGTLSDNDHQVVAVAARDLTRAQEFADKLGIAKAYDSYVKLAEDANVEVVYIGTLNPQHYEVAQLMLEHGKHVLVEKPLCMNEKQAKKLIAYAERKKLFLMEAIWSRFFPSYQYLQKQIQGGALGDIKSVKIDFGVPFNSVEILAWVFRVDIHSIGP